MHHRNIWLDAKDRVGEINLADRVSLHVKYRLLHLLLSLPTRRLQQARSTLLDGVPHEDHFTARTRHRSSHENNVSFLSTRTTFRF